MKTAVWSFYNPTTGAFIDCKLSGPEGALASNTPPDCVAIEGSFDHLSQCVDIVTGRVVDYVPPQPDAEHEWSNARRRWVKMADVLKREQRHQATQARINDLERQQLRPLRELAVAPGDAEARRRVLAIDDEIAELRQALTQA